jgi:hypothetical protein
MPSSPKQSQKQRAPQRSVSLLKTIECEATPAEFFAVAANKPDEERHGRQAEFREA